MLAEANHEVAVDSVDVSAIGTGQMADSLRLRPTYQRNESGAPATFVVKMASQDPNSRAAGERGAYLREVRFYEQLATELPVAVPASMWSAINPDTSDFALVLEDMHPATQGDQIAGSDVDSIRAAAVNIAGLHAPRWGDESLFDIEWLTSPRAELVAVRQELKAILGMFTPGFIDRYRPRITAEHIELLNWFAANVDTWMNDDGGRIGLTHGDHRLDNLLFNPNDGERPVTVVDWQTIAVRNPVADISYLLGTGVEPEVRREIEHDIVADYHERLIAHGVRNYDVDTCFDDYRRQTPQALLLTVLGSMLTGQTDRGDDMFMAMLHRGSQQIFDLDVV